MCMDSLRNVLKNLKGMNKSEFKLNLTIFKDSKIRNFLDKDG